MAPADALVFDLDDADAAHTVHLVPAVVPFDRAPRRAHGRDRRGIDRVGVPMARSISTPRQVASAAMTVGDRDLPFETTGGCVGVPRGSNASTDGVSWFGRNAVCDHRPMAIGITEEHEELRQAVRRFVDTRIPPAARARGGRRRRRGPARRSGPRSREPGWLGLHVDEAHGGAGYGLVEQAVVVEELGRACAPGPYLADRDRGRDPRGRRAARRPTALAAEARDGRARRARSRSTARVRCSAGTTPT